MPLPTAFKIADEILTNAVKGITELVTRSRLVNLDFADVKAIMSDGGVSNWDGEDDSSNRAVEARKGINKSSLMLMSNGTGALVNVIGGNDLSLAEYKTIMEIIGKTFSRGEVNFWSPDIKRFGRNN